MQVVRPKNLMLCLWWIWSMSILKSMKIRSMPFDEKLFSEMSPTLPTENSRPADIVFLKSLLYANTWLSCCGRRGRWRNRWSSSRWWRWGRRWWARVQVDKNPESGEGDEIAAEEGNPEGITSRAGSEEISWKRSQVGLIRIKCFFGKKFPACIGCIGNPGLSGTSQGRTILSRKGYILFIFYLFGKISHKWRDSM